MLPIERAGQPSGLPAAIMVPSSLRASMCVISAFAFGAVVISVRKQPSGPALIRVVLPSVNVTMAVVAGRGIHP